MKTHLVPLLVVGAAALVAGCSAAGGVAVDAGGAPDPSAGSPSTHPTAAPWPAYGVDDYTYTLRTTCFCAEANVPVDVTVRDGKVTDAVYAHRGWGHEAGDRASKWMWVTINDVIDAANTKHAAVVRVTWPEGQDHPSSVYVDRDAMMADEEIGYSIRNVTPE